MWDLIVSVPYHCLSLYFVPFSTEIHSVTPICWDFSRHLHLISHNPHLYLSISCESSSTLPAALRVLTFHIAMVMSSLPRSLAPVAHLPFPPWCPTGNTVVVLGCDQSGMGILSFLAVMNSDLLLGVCLSGLKDLHLALLGSFS